MVNVYKIILIGCAFLMVALPLLGVKTQHVDNDNVQIDNSRVNVSWEGMLSNTDCADWMRVDYREQEKYYDTVIS